MASVMECIQAQMQYDCNEDTAACWCNGSGWIVSDWDSQHKCPYHYNGQPNNEDDSLTWDMWFDNMCGNGQFMIIPQHQEEDEIKAHYLEWHLKYKVAWEEQQEEDLPF